MPLIELETQIQAPRERVFDLARSIDAHLASTHGTAERAIARRTTGLVEKGETVTWEARHLGITQHLTVRITAMDRPHSFADEMVRGAFASMRHIHRFLPHASGTLMQDEFHFVAPLGIVGRIAERTFLTRYMRTFLVQRGLALKAIAESDAWQRLLPDVPTAHSESIFRRLAIAIDHQRQGHGTTLMREAEAFATANGRTALVANVALDAIPFYMELGYALDNTSPPGDPANPRMIKSPLNSDD